MKMGVEHWWKDTDREKIIYSEKNLSQWSNTNLSRTDLGWNTGLLDEKTGPW
jgi:hypothetical protein